MVIISHPSGNNNVRQVACALFEISQLLEFQTCIAACGGNIFETLATLPGFAQINRRSLSGALSPHLRLHPWREIGRLLAARLGARFLTQHETGIFSVDAVYQSFDKSIAKHINNNRKKVSVVYAYEDGALETFKSAKKIGAKCIYDLPIGYWRAGHKIMQEEAEFRPEWAKTMPGLQDSKNKLERKDEELSLADRIIVASSFTKNTLEDYPATLAPISMIPYGCGSIAESAENKKPIGPLRVLFVGGLSQRKGIADLFDAMNLLRGVATLTLIGRKSVSDCPALNHALKAHHWIPTLTHDAILQEMRKHDVLVFPSLFEGFGLVVTEALSQGLPVITTANTCGPDIITHGRDGFIIPIRSPESIAESLVKLHEDRSILLEMGFNARYKAREFSWLNYRETIARVVQSMIATA